MRSSFNAPIPHPGRRARSHWRCRVPFKAGLCRVGRDDRRQSQVREAYVTSKDHEQSARRRM